jgi:hypothetical protein
MNFSLDLACLGAFALATVLFLMWRMLFKQVNAPQQKQRPKEANNFDLSPYKVSDQLNLWMFDNLLSKKFLDYVDEQFEAQDLPVHHEKVVSHEKSTRSLMLPLDENTVEFTNLLEKLGHFVPAEACPVLVISEVWGDDQGAHLDHVEFDNLAPLYQNLQFIDGQKQRRHPENPDRVVPTLSIVVYFNDEGSIVFPKLGMELEGKRGRIFMWQNYHDEKRPEANCLATHFGTYSHSRCKRVMACGVLANETPDPTKTATTKGALYCPNACGHHQHHDSSMNQAYNDNQKLFFVSEQDKCMHLEVRVTKCTWDDIKWSYQLEFTNNLVNSHYKVCQTVQTRIQSQLEASTAKSCGQGQDEVIVFYLLAHLLGIDPHEACGWVCSCHLCNYTCPSKNGDVAERIRKQIVMHEKTLLLWKEAGVLKSHPNFWE